MRSLYGVPVICHCQGSNHDTQISQLIVFVAYTYIPSDSAE